jgi:hypothetical protein
LSQLRIRDIFRESGEYLEGTLTMPTVLEVQTLLVASAFRFANEVSA